MRKSLASLRLAEFVPSFHDAGREVFAFDGLKRVFFALHVSVILYVGLGWLMPSRVGLYIYLLVLPLIVMQWILNGGSSILSNLENVLRVGRWSDPNNRFEGALFQSFLRPLGVRASQGQITTVLCSLMLIFWLAAMCRMILIVVPPPA